MVAIAKKVSLKKSPTWERFGKRYYDPLTSSWIGRDPARQYYSPYLYVGANPIVFVDPDGNRGGWPKQYGTQKPLTPEQIYRNEAQYKIVNGFVNAALTTISILPSPAQPFAIGLSLLYNSTSSDPASNVNALASTEAILANTLVSDPRIKLTILTLDYALTLANTWVAVEDAYEGVDQISTDLIGHMEIGDIEIHSSDSPQSSRVKE